MQASSSSCSDIKINSNKANISILVVASETVEWRGICYLKWNNFPKIPCRKDTNKSLMHFDIWEISILPHFAWFFSSSLPAPEYHNLDCEASSPKHEKLEHIINVRYEFDLHSHAYYPCKLLQVSLTYICN